MELDGSQHTEEAAVQYDAERTSYFESLGLSVLRYYNTDISKNFGGVCQHILNTLQQQGISPELHFPE